MLKLLVKLWNDDAGYLLSTESVMLGTVMTMGIMGGLVGFRNSTIEEINGMSNSFKDLKTYHLPTKKDSKDKEIEQLNISRFQIPNVAP